MGYQLKPKAGPNDSVKNSGQFNWSITIGLN